MKNAATKIQTGLRLNPALYNRLKIAARRQSRSFNSYVEQVLSASVEVEYPRLGENFHISEEILGLGNTMPQYTQEEILSDDRLSYLLSK